MQSCSTNHWKKIGECSVWQVLVLVYKIKAAACITKFWILFLAPIATWTFSLNNYSFIMMVSGCKWSMSKKCCQPNSRSWLVHVRMMSGRNQSQLCVRFFVKYFAVPEIQFEGIYVWIELKLVKMKKTNKKRRRRIYKIIYT